MNSSLYAWFLALPLFVSLPARAAEPILSFKSKIGVDGTLGWMNRVAFSPDGAIVASGGSIPVNNPGLSLWTFPEGKLLRKLQYAPLALSADWKFLVTEDALIDMATEKTVVSLSDRFGKLESAAFTQDGEHLAFTIREHLPVGPPPRVRVVRVGDGEVVSEFGKRRVSGLEFGPTGALLATGQWDNVILWDWKIGEQTALFPGFGRYVYGIGFSKDGDVLAAGTDSGDLQIWDVPNRRHLHTVHIGGGDYVSNPAFSPDRKLVAAGTYANGTLSLIDAASGERLSQVRISEYGCGSVAFSPDGRYLVAPSNGGQIGPRRHDRDTGGTIRVFEVQAVE